MLNSRLILLLCLVIIGTAACSNRWAAPVEERAVGGETSKHPLGNTQAAIYTVKRGDSLYTIGFRYGLDYHSIADWNRITKPFTIYPGQKLHLQPGQKPFSKPATVKTQPLKPGSTTKSTTKVAAKPVAATTSKTASTKTPVKTSSKTPPKSIDKSSSTTSSRSSVRWQWPTNGTIIETYLAGDPTRSGLDIAGKEGQAIRAAASGSVVYSGNGLLGYGELIIIKHDDRFLSAYAHNRVRLVTEGESIRAGQKIAEMGRGESGRIKLHFEIRANGKPVNPRQYLPRR
ncbi:MAG: peptidoglycan DD-metalloendopeptidase family protein [Proteobacteria bacterium]|nr:peptidoglycan DD-metalloendopeptidase family protein [Pseudomonadota bacterium]